MNVVTGVVGNDVHVVANRLIEISLKERGFTVYNLGVNTYLEEFLDAVLETDAELLLVSSLNGEAEGWCRNLKILRSRYRFRRDPLFVIGGNLGVGEMDPETLGPKYRGYGFDLVYHQVDLNEALDEVERVLEARR